MIKNNCVTKTLAELVLCVAVSSSVTAQTADTLIDKLVEKGVLTVKEGNDLRTESDKDFSKAYSMKSGMPEWVRTMKLTGDIRLRYDQISINNGTFPDGTPGSSIPDRDRFRFRLRFGAIASLSDNMEAGLRLSTGSGGPLSANQTMDGNASRKAIFVDLAYAKWTPEPWVEVQGGKMQNAFWMSDMVFDPDYNPEGLQEKFTLPLFSGNHTLHYTAGQWVVSENPGSISTSGTDTYLLVNQVDWTGKWTKKFSTRAAIGVYNFIDQSGISSAANTTGQNGTPAGGAGSQKFTPIITRVDATYNLKTFPLYTGECPITAMAEYANNVDASSSYDRSTAYNIGATLGSAKARGNWQISYNYKVIPTASLWSGLNDDDFGFNGKGGTDVRGHLITASYHLLDPLTIGLRYFLTEQINNSPGIENQQHRVMVDLMWVF